MTLEYMHGHDRFLYAYGPAAVFSHADPRVLDLPLARLPSKLGDNLEDLPDTGRSQWMPFRDEPPACIHGDLSTQ